MEDLRKKILELQKFDGLHEAEQVTGKSYKEDKGTESLGFLLHIEKGAAMREMLSQVGDTQFSNKVNDYLRITSGFGFEVAYQESFKDLERNKEESLYVLFNKELGIILCFDTYGENVNGGDVYYNWSPNSMDCYRLTSSGRFIWSNNTSHMALYEDDFSKEYIIPDYPAPFKWGSGMEYEEFKKLEEPVSAKRKELFDLALADGKRFVWSGGHDCREGIITTIMAMCENGKFLPVWKECAFSWLTHYVDHRTPESRGYNLSPLYEITKTRLKSMPESVKNCINNTYKK
jgi:hypothetical protein